jgi:hypothetical protein
MTALDILVGRPTTARPRRVTTIDKIGRQQQGCDGRYQQQIHKSLLSVKETLHVA